MSAKRLDLPFATELEVEARKQEISTALEMCSVDIKTEKKLLNELEVLFLSIEGIRALNAEVEKCSVLQNTRHKMSALHQEKADELNLLREEEKKLLSRI